MTVSDDLKKGANYGLGVGAGYSVYKYVPTLAKKPVRNYLLNTITKIPQADNDTYWRAANEAYDNSFLSQSVGNKKPITDLFEIPETADEKRVKILHVDRNNIKEVYDEIITKLAEKEADNKYKNKWPFTKLTKRFKKDVEKHVKITAKGQNAFCIPKVTKNSSLVVVNKDKMGFSTFHELGHAVNAHTPGIKMMLSKSRGFFAVMAPLTFFAALLTNRTEKDNTENMTFKQKFKNFVKDHCGIIATACMLPTLAEEGLASINGAKLAKNVLDKDMYKKLNKLNTKAWCSYLAGAAIIGVATQLAVKTRDIIVGAKPVK